MRELLQLQAPVYPDDVDELPAGSVVDGRLQTADLEDAADFVVIGSGAAGATAAKVLAEAGWSVILLEEGPYVRTREFSTDVFPALKTMFRDAGANMATGKAPFPLLQGRCVGGSTTINSAIAWRAPGAVVDRWSREFGLDEAITDEKLDAHYAALERELQVRPVDDRKAGNHNRLFGEAALKLGIRSSRIQRYDGGCEASASCITGCRTAKKMSMNVTYVPQTLHQGGKLYSSVRVRSITSEYGRATGVVGYFQAPGSPRLKAHARRGVVVAASAIQTPGVLRRSGVRLPALGKHFQAHPGSSIAACFDRPIAMEFGATQGFNSTHFVDSNRYKLEALSLPPEMLAVRVPGVGKPYMEKLLDYRHAINWAVVVRADAEGTVRSVLGRELVSFTPSYSDVARFRQGFRTLSEMMFAVGAKEVWPSVHGVPVLRSPDDLKFWDDASLDPRAYSMMASHLFGSARMGPDPKDAVVGLDFQVHGLRGAYVVDSSVFPTNLGVNPQHTIMAVAHLAASQIAEFPLPPKG